MGEDKITKELLESYIGRLADKIDAQSANSNLQMQNLRESFDLKLDNLELKVDQTLEQATRTNGRVTVLETKPHPIANCPQAVSIKQLSEDVAAIKTERKFLAKVAAFTAAAITLIISVLKIFF